MSDRCRFRLNTFLRSSSSRRLTTVITILGIALVVFVFTAVLMMANGVEKTLRSTGSDDNLIVVRKAAMSEIMSILDRDAASIISNMPQVASFADGRPMSSKEAVVIINLNKIGARGNQQRHRARRRIGRRSSCGRR